MTDTTTANLISKKERRFGGLSLICLLLAVLGFVSMILPRGHVDRADASPGLVAVAARIGSLVLAVPLGILGRRSRAGKFALAGSGALLAIFLLVTVFLVSRHAATVAQPAPAAQLPH